MAGKKNKLKRKRIQLPLGRKLMKNIWPVRLVSSGEKRRNSVNGIYFTLSFHFRSFFDEDEKKGKKREVYFPLLSFFNGICSLPQDSFSFKSPTIRFQLTRCSCTWEWVSLHSFKEEKTLVGTVVCSPYSSSPACRTKMDKKKNSTIIAWNIFSHTVLRPQYLWNSCIRKFISKVKKTIYLSTFMGIHQGLNFNQGFKLCSLHIIQVVQNLVSKMFILFSLYFK